MESGGGWWLVARGVKDFFCYASLLVYFVIDSFLLRMKSFDHSFPLTDSLTHSHAHSPHSLNSPTQLTHSTHSYIHSIIRPTHSITVCGYVWLCCWLAHALRCSIFCLEQRIFCLIYLLLMLLMLLLLLPSHLSESDGLDCIVNMRALVLILCCVTYYASLSYGVTSCLNRMGLIAL